MTDAQRSPCVLSAVRPRAIAADGLGAPCVGMRARAGSEFAGSGQRGQSLSGSASEARATAPSVSGARDSRAAAVRGVRGQYRRRGAGLVPWLGDHVRPPAGCTRLFGSSTWVRVGGVSMPCGGADRVRANDCGSVERAPADGGRAMRTGWLEVQAWFAPRRLRSGPSRCTRGGARSLRPARSRRGRYLPGHLC